jgi:hypothetical protein
MHFFTEIPWVNILFSEKTVMTVRRHFRNEGAIRYNEIKNGLNQMTVRQFEGLVASSGMRPVYWKLECSKGLDGLAKILLLREFFREQCNVHACGDLRRGWGTPPWIVRRSSGQARVNPCRRRCRLHNLVGGGGVRVGYGLAQYPAALRTL